MNAVGTGREKGRKKGLKSAEPSILWFMAQSDSN
jgi:hypothetical protein